VQKVFVFRLQSCTPQKPKTKNLKPDEIEREQTMSKTQTTLLSGWRLVAVVAVVALAAFFVGRAFRGGHDHSPNTQNLEPKTTSQKPEVWSCPMHPQIRQPQFGQCPICGMNLVKIEADDAGDRGDAPVLRLSARAAALMEIQTQPVERRHVEAERRFLGKFVFDETRLFDIVTRTEGQLERLFLNYAGVPVRAGEHVAEIFSAEFLTATQELLLAKNANNAPLLEAAKTKLRLLEVSDEQIADILREGKPRKAFTLFSPATGVVAELGGRQGAWVMKGARVAQIADISSLWILLDAYESDLALIHYGQQVKLEVPAFAGRAFTGFVAYVSPDLDERTRTIKVRVNVPNADGSLRPGMFARAVLKVPLSAEGKAYGPELAGKWICPMHPEIVSDKTGTCSICGMPLEPAEKLGHVRAETKVTHPLVIPATAPLITGKRAVVYVRQKEADAPTFEGRVVTLGPRVGEFYVVLDGVTEGELVVTNGNFKLDSELQIRGLPSMMGMADGGEREASSVERKVKSHAVPEGFGRQIAAVTKDYLALVTALAADDFDAAKKAAMAMSESVRAVDAAVLEGDAATEWKTVFVELEKPLRAMMDAQDIKGIRAQLQPLTNHTEHAVVGFGGGQVGKLYRLFCPMALDDKGATWLQDNERVANPYFGSEMLRCGEVKGEVGAKQERRAPSGGGHQH
jgi:Cu(I)/Ag(I) efflux system membrane fusion protein